MQFLQSRYARLTLVTLGLGLLLWAVLWLILLALGLTDFPVGLQVAAAFLGAGLLVYKYLARRII